MSVALWIHKAQSGIAHRLVDFGAQHRSYFWAKIPRVRQKSDWYRKARVGLRHFSPGLSSSHVLHQQKKIKGFKDPNNRVVGPTYYNISGIWALKPSYLGPWNLRETHVLLNLGSK